MFRSIIRSSVWNMNTEMPLIQQTNLVTRGLLTYVVNKEVEKTPEVAESRVSPITFCSPVSSEDRSTCGRRV